MNEKRLGRALCLLFVIFALAGCGDGDTPVAPQGADPDPGPEDETPGVGSSGPGFDLEIRFVGDAPAYAAAFAEAQSRWEQVIVGDLPDAVVDFPGGGCHEALQETVDDVIVFVEVVPIDGSGDVLGEAGPCLIRDDPALPITGVLRLDSADLDDADAVGVLEDLITHEMGHVLGFGTVWRNQGLLTGLNSIDPHFTGDQAAEAFDDVGGGSYAGNPVPVENTGGPGTRNVHWRESIFGSELMTGFLSIGSIPLSAVSIGSLGDLGYTVDLSAAEDFRLGFAALVGPTQSFEIGREVLLEPRFSVESSGRVRPMR